MTHISQRYMTEGWFPPVSDNLAKYFKTKPINMNDKITIDKLNQRLKVNITSYNNFKENFLGFPSAETSYEIIYDLIKRNQI